MWSSEDEFKILAIDGDCYESMPCQHRCVCEYPDGHKVKTLVRAGDILRLGRDIILKSQSLLEHFVYYDRSLEPILAELEQQQQSDPEYIKNLESLKQLHKNYINHIEKVCVEVVNKVGQMSIKESLFTSMKNGYSGFALCSSSFVGAMNRKQKNRIATAISDKLYSEKLVGLVKVSVLNSVCIYVNLHEVATDEEMDGVNCQIHESEEKV